MTTLSVDLICFCSNNSALPPTPVELRKIAAASPAERPRVGSAESTRSSTYLTTSERREVVAKYADGASTRALALEFKVGKSTVLAIVTAAGVTRRFNSISSDDLQKALPLYESGLSLSQVTAELPYSQNTIRVALRDAGVQMRPSGGSARGRRVIRKRAPVPDDGTSN